MQATEIKLSQKNKTVEITFDNEKKFLLSCEYLRGHTPSADKKPSDSKDVNIISIEPVGNYAVKLIFDDGHDTGLYTWEYLYELGQQNKKTT